MRFLVKILFFSRKSWLFLSVMSVLLSDVGIWGMSLVFLGGSL